MIGTVKRLIVEEKIANVGCPHCNELNSLQTKVYSNVFILGLLGFGYGKGVSVDCKNCKKMFLNIYDLPPKIKDKVEDIMSEAKHKWYAYSGYVIIGIIYLWGIFLKK